MVSKAEAAQYRAALREHLVAELGRRRAEEILERELDRALRWISSARSAAILAEHIRARGSGGVRVLDGGELVLLDVPLDSSIVDTLTGGRSA